MPHALRTLVIVLLAALLPLRALAAVTTGYCAAGHQDMTVAAHGDHGQDAGSHAHHGGDDQPAKPATPSCSSCVEHCSNAAVAPSAAQAVASPAVAQDRIFVAERVAPAFVPDQLDRPPLAPLR
jgi:hypothetical protein